MIRQALRTLQDAGADIAVETVLADGGYWNSPQITALRRDTINAIVPTSASHRIKPRKLSPRQGLEAERINRLLESPDGKALYRRWEQMIEPVFANTKFNRGITRFHRRGLAACRAEWR
jgi:Transposase DDE domain